MPSLFLILFSVPLLYALYKKLTGKLTAETICIVMLACGFILRVAYAWYTDDYQRQHDIGHFDEDNNEHSGYMMYLLNNKHLPDFSPEGKWQFYHPPLHHIISALILALIRALGYDIAEYGPGVLQYVAVIYSMLFCLFAYKSLKALGLKGAALSLPTAVIVFHPTLIILSGSINNDMLSSLFGMTAIYFTIRWASSKRFRDIIAIALSVGLGMMTKLTVGLLAPAIAAVFLCVLIKTWKERSASKKGGEKELPRPGVGGLFAQFVSFGVICVPLGLYWPIRNLVKFGTPLNYVPLMSENSGQYIDMKPLERLFDFSIKQFASPFTQWEWFNAPYNEYNPIIALLKNSMFDERTFFRDSITLQSFCTALFIAGVITAVLSFFAVILLLSKRTEIRLEHRLLLFIVYSVIFGNYIIFCFNFPHVCTQNMRYCVPLIFSGAAALGFMIARTENGKQKFLAKISKTAKFGMTSMAALCAFVYTALMFYETAKKL